MKIIIIAPKFYPKNSPRANRALELSKEFASRGHQVTVYTDMGGFDYSDITKRFNILVKNIPNLRFYKAGNNGNVKYSIFERLLIRLLRNPLYYPDIELAFKVPEALKKEKHCDLLISIAYPYSSHIGVALTLRKRKDLYKTWVADCGDPFYKNSFISLPFYFGYVEKWMFSHADYVTVPTDVARSSYPSTIQDKIRIIPQGFNFSYIKIANYEPNKIITFGYAGTLYKKKRDPKLFLNYLISLSINFRFIVYTRNKNFFDEYLDTLNDKLVLKDFIEREILIFELSKMDFLVNLENDVLEHVPSKLLDYSVASRPILNVSSVKLDTNIIDEFLNRNFTHSLKISNINRYDIKNVVNEFLNLADISDD